MSKEIIPFERIARSIYLLRGQRVLLDRDLAALYDVETRALNQAVKRNVDRFPDDFVFTLSREEIERISQNVTSLSRLELAQKFSELERRIDKHDEEIAAIIEAIRQLMAPPEKPRREIGFHVQEKPGRYRVRVGR